jgi:ABC-type lipoprotein release transport system permease subunit
MYFTYIWRELRHRHRQALLMALGLAVGIALVVAVTAYAGGVKNAQDDVLHSLYGVGTDITVTQTAKFGSGGPSRIGMDPGQRKNQGKSFSRDAIRGNPGQQSMSAAKVAATAKLRNVSAAAGGLTLTSMHVQGKFAQAFNGQGGQSGAAQGGQMPAPSASQAPIKIDSYSIAGVDVTQMGLGPLSSSTATAGRLLQSSDATSNVIVVDKGYAKQHDLQVGSTKKIGGTKFAIVGIVTPSSGSSSTSNVYMPLSRAQKVSGETGKVNTIYVRAGSADQIASVKKEIKGVMPKATVTTAQDLADQVSGSLSSASSLADRLGKWLAVAALAAAFLVASLLTVSAVSRRVREFGTLKALGWKSRRIVAQVMGESLVQGIAGGIVGVALGIGAARLIVAFSPELQAKMGNTVAAPPGAPPGAQGMMEALGGAAQTVTVTLGAPISLNLVLLAVGLAIAGGLLAGAFGGWRAARLRPADALRRLD